MFGGIRRYYLLIYVLLRRRLRRKVELINIGNFWCQEHFALILESQKTSDPIDYYIATMAVGRFITLSTDHETEGPLTCACERIPKEVLAGIFERSKGWLPAK